MEIEEIMIRQLANQYLIGKADVMTVVKNLCGIQAQFFSNALHAIRIRCTAFDGKTDGYELVKNWSLRGTMHLFAKEDLKLFAGCYDEKKFRNNDWHTPSFWNQRPEWALTPERQSFFSAVILSALREEDKTREELKQLCRDRGMNESEESCMFHPWGGGIRELCERGFVHYLPQEKKSLALSPDFQPLPKAEADLELARRYFTHYGPATIHDAMYFFHTSATAVKKWLAVLPVHCVNCEGKEYFYIENGQAYENEMPDCIFLSGFDPLLLGYEKKESLYLGKEELRGIFNLGGIVMPAVLLRGKIIGKWKMKNDRLQIIPFSGIASTEKEMIERYAYETWEHINKIQFDA